MKKMKFILSFALICVAANWNVHAQNAMSNSIEQITKPLSLVDCLNIALQQNAAISEARNDLRAKQGVVIQTRAVALPQINVTSQYKKTERSDIESFPSASQPPDQNWNAGVQIVQTIYDGGKMIAAVRASGAQKKEAIAQYNVVVADALLAVQTAYFDVLLASNLITVHEASVNLLQKELEDQQNRYNAGTVPKFNVLRADVAVANERPNLIHAKNNYRITKNNLSNLLGYNLPHDVFEDIPLQLTDTLDDTPYEINLPDAIQQGLSQRSELEALRQHETLQKLNVVSTRSGYQPTISAFAGYTWNNSQFIDPDNLGYTLHGWNFGGQLTWNLFDGFLTHGKVVEAKALYDKSKTDLADESRRIELDVRTAYSQFVEAKEVLQSQEKVQEEAEEALREAEARQQAGTSTQLDVLDAETALTQARSTQFVALHEYDVARSRLERAIGQDMAVTTK